MAFMDNQITIPIDSSFVNAVVYIIFDLGIAAAFGSILCKLQGAITSHRLRKGKRVTLREAPTSAITGGILRDNSYAWLVLSLIQILVFIALFIATLGITGRTSESAIPIQLDYITYLPKDAPTIRHFRQSPPIFSSCVTSDPPQLLYRPTAFNIVGDSSIAIEGAFKDQFGNPVQINSSTSVCQDFEGVRPVLTVLRCGRGVDECSTFNVSSGVLVRMVKNQEGDFLRGGYTKNIALWKKLKVPAGVLSSIAYSHMICSVRHIPPRTGEQQVQYLCTAGHFDLEAQVYTFRIGRLNFSAMNTESVHNNSLDSVATFTPYSAEVEMKYNMIQSRNMFFAIMLHQHSAKRLVAAREFLDSIVNRLTSARKVEGDKLQKRITKQVTDVHLFSIAIYATLIVVTVIFMTLTRALRFRNGPSSAAGRINGDVTSYDWVVGELHSAALIPHEKGASFGLVCDKEQETFHVRPVHKEQKLSQLPNDALLR